MKASFKFSVRLAQETFLEDCDYGTDGSPIPLRLTTFKIHQQITVTCSLPVLILADATTRVFSYGAEPV